TEIVCTCDSTILRDYERRIALRKLMPFKFALISTPQDKIHFEPRDVSLRNRLGMMESTRCSSSSLNSLQTSGSIQTLPTKYIFVLHPFIEEPTLREIWAVATFNDLGGLTILRAQSPLTQKQRDWLQKRYSSKDTIGCNQIRLTLMDENGRLIDTQQKEISAFLTWNE